MRDDSVCAGYAGIDPAAVAPPPEYSLFEQAEQGRRRLVRNRESLGAKLLTNLQRLHLGRLFREIGVDHRAKARVQCVDLVVVVAKEALIKSLSTRSRNGV